jgi:hypothetical protein
MYPFLGGSKDAAADVGVLALSARRCRLRRPIQWWAFLATAGACYSTARRLRGEQGYQNQARDHAADESDRPDKLLQQRLISVNAIRRWFEWPVLAGAHVLLS